MLSSAGDRLPPGFTRVPAMGAKASADPAFGADAARWSPEDLLVAALPGCHMLTYLALCALAGIVVTGDEDIARGRMAETPAGGGHFTDVILAPTVTIDDPDQTDAATALHEQAHRDCFIANSVNFPVLHSPVVRAHPWTRNL